ncbi:MAG TPA: adenylate/guanylate cyclase domain-containing protein [Acidimicrobiia bacterium]|nr:adenylate/guanylate cyclase domain-containing protein [Acidimicrobiia bacterium]
MTALPEGTVTFLFTDVEGSTRLWQEYPEAMPDVSARHDEILREAIESRSGYVVKTTGDGFHAAFADAADAIDAAIAGQLALGAEEWPLPTPLRARMGVHTGRAELRDGDYYGTAVNRAARLMSVAHGGQIIVSLATEELVQDGTVALVDLGEHALRDLSRPERVFQVAQPGLETEFPPLASLHSFAGNLPVQLTSFVGRDNDVRRIVEMLGEASLVTLIGTGGVGKTRLAVQVAAEVVPRFEDGAWFCELATVDDGEAMAQVIASALGCLQRPGLSLRDSIVEFVKVRELLLVLDNCEHLLDDAGAIADAVLRKCPKVRVVATSREALDVTGEHVIRVRSLEAPDASATIDDVTASTAVRLFRDRAADAGAESGWDAVQLAAVGEICRRVDGIPLAIELAAARVVSMSPADVASHLDERFRLLTGKRRGRVERHQTLRATVEWSYQLLDDDERAVFDRLGVFAGPFAAPAAVAVAGGDDLDAWEVTDAISSLVAKSMVGTETGPDGTGRYSLNETLRQYARERLDEAGTADRGRRSHAEHYASWAREVGRGMTGPDDTLWTARLRAELDNVRAAVGWALDRDAPDDQELAVRILACLTLAGRAAADSSLDTLAAQAAPVAEAARPELRAPVLALAGYHEWNQGHGDRARSLGQAAIRDGVVAEALYPFESHEGAAVFEMTSGHTARALEVIEEGRRALGGFDDYTVAYFLGSMATFEAMAGRFDQARVDAERALELARPIGNKYLLGIVYHGMAWALQRDDPAAALDATEQFLDIYLKFDVGGRSIAGALALAAGLRARVGDDVGALEFVHEAVLISRDQGHRPQLAAALDWGLNPLLRTGRPGVTATFLGALTAGTLAEVGNFPGVDAARARSLDRVRDALGGARTDQLLKRGAAMTYDELVEYAVDQLAPPTRDR